MLIALPRSSPRNKPGIFLKLLTAVEPHAGTGFGFSGLIRQPGAAIELELAPKYPIVLECAGTQNPRDGVKSTRHWPTLYLLWRFDPRSEAYQEIARALSDNWDWAVELRPIAIRLLEEAQGRAVEVYQGLDLVFSRIESLVAREIATVAPRDRNRAVNFFHDLLCAKLAAFTESRA